jgi:hypothetical protein
MGMTLDIGIQDEILDQMARKLCQDIDNEIIWDMTKQSNCNWHLVQIPWRTEPEGHTWNDACIWALETFGLPGELYQTHPSGRSMEFLFKNEKDAILMSLKWI